MQADTEIILLFKDINAISPHFRRNEAVCSPLQMVLNETNAPLVVRDRALSGRKLMFYLGRGGFCFPVATAAVQIFPMAFSLSTS